MGARRTRAQDLAAASRFLEGSMSDRASAVPPVAFLGPAERAILERPVDAAAADGDDDDDKAQRPPQQGRRTRLGMVWEGVRGRFRLRREAAGDKGGGGGTSKRTRSAAAVEEKRTDGGAQQWPSRDEVLNNYHQLVASGFFTSHAVHSTRQPRRPSTAHETSSQAAAPRPKWPLAPTPSSPHMCSPASAASSRGTKRAATDDDDDDASTLAQRFLPKRLRRCASRDMALPKLRAAANTVRRTVSGADDPPARLSKRNPYGAVALSPTLLRARDGLRAPRALRPRVVAGPLSVVPDVNRGIPRMPAIPVKFARGQDAENDGPCRR